jgi:hypothetical protein
LSTQFDSYLFHESNLKEEHINMDNWDIAGLATRILSYRDSRFRRTGSIFGHIPEVQSQILDFDNPNNFEIIAIRLCTATQEMTIISAYKSPSMLCSETEDFFSYLCEIINQINGQIALIGDLNIAKGRSFRLGETEDKFIDMITETGLYSRYDQPTRKKVQLDYVFSNFPGVKCMSATDASIGVLSTNDHDAICIQFEFSLDIINVPETIISTNDLDDEAKQAIVNFGSQQLLNHPKVSIGRLLLEKDILMWQIEVATQETRIIYAHKRVRGASRQMSATIFNEKLDPIVKQDQLAEQRLIETARRIHKNANSPKLAHALYAIYSMTAKSNQLLECKIDPERFAAKILADEKRNDHAKHPKREKMVEIMLPKDQVVTQKLLDKLKSKWIDKAMFSEPFWRYISNGTFTEQDRGVYTYNSVETVVKDKSCPAEMKGWRLVWKTPSTSEKTLDLIRACHVNTKLLNNDAYCQDRSTQRTLAQIFSWYIGNNEGLFGIDFVNAFAEVCRSCANTLFGHNLVSEEIEFSCATTAGRSANYISINGSGAGRATGGPAFNICFQQIVDKLSKTIDKNNICPYADDSQIKIKLVSELINKVVQCFKDAHKIGLQVHSSGKKGPTLLVSKKANVPKGLLDKLVGVQVEIKEEITFLGIDISIDQKSRYLKATLTKKSKQLLGFYVNEMARTIWTYNNKNPIVNQNTDIFDKISQAIASFLESRMQYSIAYSDAKTIVYFYNIHKKAICSLLGFTTTSFGFKWASVNNNNYIEDFYSFLDNLCSETYKKLCMLAGKPTLMAMAHRAVTVINQQLLYDSGRGIRVNFNKFSMKLRSFMVRYSDNPENTVYSHLEPKRNEFFETREFFKTLKERRIFIRASVDCLLLTHLYARGYDTATTCRICNTEDETLSHVLTEHITVPLGPGLNRNIGKFSKREKRHLQGKSSRVVLFPDAETCYALTTALRDVNVPSKLPYRPPKDPKRKPISAGISQSKRKKYPP